MQNNSRLHVLSYWHGNLRLRLPRHLWTLPLENIKLDMLSHIQPQVLMDFVHFVALPLFSIMCLSYYKILYAFTRTTTRRTRHTAWRPVAPRQTPGRRALYRFLPTTPPPAYLSLLSLNIPLMVCRVLINFLSVSSLLFHSGALLLTFRGTLATVRVCQAGQDGGGDTYFKHAIQHCRCRVAASLSLSHL